MKRFILSLDQGTTSSRAILFDIEGNIVASDQKEFKQYFPRPGWVEHDPLELLDTQIKCIKNCLEKSKIDVKQIACLGITNQRETTVVWNKKTGKPIYNAIVWQCRRTQELATRLGAESNEFREKTGLIPDAYFSGPKIKWILDNCPDAYNQAQRGELLFGTIDSWLIWNFTGKNNHVTEASNASRTLCFNIHTGTWDKILLNRLDIPENMMPEIKPANGQFGITQKEIVGLSVPITGVLGDQQAALFGQACLSSSMAKCTYGTGGFLLVNIGNTARLVPGLLTTIAWQMEGKQTHYALEGAMFIFGAAIQWLRDGLQILDASEKTEPIARSISGNDGVYFVPALVGLGSPWWNSNVRGTITGITRGTTRAHFIRAALEAMAYQVKDVAVQMKEHKLSMTELKVDGGATRNSFILQFQADLLQIPILKSAHTEATAWGAAAMAGIGAGLINNTDNLANLWITEKSFLPQTDRSQDYKGWQQALKGAFACALTE